MKVESKNVVQTMANCTLFSLLRGSSRFMNHKTRQFCHVRIFLANVHARCTVFASKILKIVGLRLKNVKCSDNFHCTDLKREGQKKSSTLNVELSE